MELQRHQVQNIRNPGSRQKHENSHYLIKWNAYLSKLETTHYQLSHIQEWPATDLHQTLALQYVVYDSSTNHSPTRNTKIRHSNIISSYSIWWPRNPSIGNLQTAPGHPYNYSLDLLTKSVDWQISGGYFNSKHPLWNSRTKNATKKSPFGHVQHSNYFVCTLSTSTHFLTYQQYRPNVPFFVQTHNSNELSTDHKLILLEVSSISLSLSHQFQTDCKKYNKTFFNLLCNN